MNKKRRRKKMMKGTTMIGDRTEGLLGKVIKCNTTACKR